MASVWLTYWHLAVIALVSAMPSMAMSAPPLNSLYIYY